MSTRNPRTICCVEGCTNPRHITRSGKRRAYCSAHQPRSEQKRRPGLPPMNGAQARALALISEASKGGSVFAPIPKAACAWQTLRSLVRADYIVEAPAHVAGPDEQWYTITRRGKTALELYTQPSTRRYDGLCPRCGIRQRQRYSSGRLGDYCNPCARKKLKAAYDSSQRRQFSTILAHTRDTE